MCLSLAHVALEFQSNTPPTSHNIASNTLSLFLAFSPPPSSFSASSNYFSFSRSCFRAHESKCHWGNRGWVRISAIIHVSRDISVQYCTAWMKDKEKERMKMLAAAMTFVTWGSRVQEAHTHAHTNSITYRVSSASLSRYDGTGWAKLSYSETKGSLWALCPNRQIFRADVWLSLICYGVFHG